MRCVCFLLLFSTSLVLKVNAQGKEEEDWGDGLKVLRTYVPESCEYRAKESDIIHYHYVGRLSKDGSIFGKSFDYNTPYIVALGHGRIIAGMDRGLLDTCLWERRRISFPPHLGYGERGVGSTIPPNSSLVFYIRLIKIERNGLALGEDEDISSIWDSALSSYTSQKWHQAVDMTEEALRLFARYEDHTLDCIKKCDKESVSERTKKSIAPHVESNSLLEHFVRYGVKGECVRKCKREKLPQQLQGISPVLVKQFHHHEPYSYLHFSYYKLGEVEEAARCCFTFLHYNPADKLALASLPFYRIELNLTKDDYIYREQAIVSYQEPYLQGVQAYNEKRWLEALDHFEKSLQHFKQALSDCYFLCEDVINVNLTQPNMNQVKKDLLEDYGFNSNTMEYYELLVTSIKGVLDCRERCYNRVSIINLDQVEDYLSSHFDYLQFVYFKLGRLNEAVQSAATFLALKPSSEVMSSNRRYYFNTYKVSKERFTPDEVYVDIHTLHEANMRLLHFAEHGVMKKRVGEKGDNGEHQQMHQEL